MLLTSTEKAFTGNLKYTYCSLLVHISSVGQKVHHTVIVALPGCPDQRSGAILPRQRKYDDLAITQERVNNYYERIINNGQII